MISIPAAARSYSKAVLALTALIFFATSATAQQPASQQSGFKVVTNPGGGQYIYGPIPGKGTMPEAIVYTLRNIHEYFGNRPEPGKFFQSRDGSEVAAFFTVNAKNLNDKPMTGLMIVAHNSDGSASTAILFDDKARFGSTEPGLMKALSAAWRPASGATGGDSPSESQRAAATQGGAAAALTRTSGGDQSAVISLPAGWKTTLVSGGAVAAEGTHGEKVFLGLLYQGYEMGPDLWTNFVNINNQIRRSKGLPQATYTLISQTKVPGQMPSVQVQYKADLVDGFGPRTGGVRLVSWGARAMQIYGSNMPDRVAKEEAATMQAIFNSYHTNDQVVAREQQGALDRVHADAARAQAQSAAIDARRESSFAAYNQHISNLDAQFSANDAHMDNIDRASKMNQDYILDRSVVTDNENGDRGTVSNNYADSLVRGNPNRYQIVPNQDLIKGRDY
jgi:hypothetical protein